MIIFIMTSLITTVLLTLNTGDITCNGIALLITEKIRHVCNVSIINSISKVITSKAYITIVIVSKVIISKVNIHKVNIHKVNIH